MRKRITRIEKFGSRFTSVVVVETTIKIVGPPDPLSWWSCGPLLIKVCVKPWSVDGNFPPLYLNIKECV